MTRNDKKAILNMAKRLIEELQYSNDDEFVDNVICAIYSEDDCTLDDMLEELENNG